MPIKGLTDTVLPSFPVLGKLRKGGPKGERGYGAELSYFRFSGAVPGIEQKFGEVYGAQPAALTVSTLPSRAARSSSPTATVTSPT
jgi:hypothetical protein